MSRLARPASQLCARHLLSAPRSAAILRQHELLRPSATRPHLRAFSNAGRSEPEEFSPGQHEPVVVPASARDRQEAIKPMKRFYQSVSVKSAGDSWHVLLDGTKTIKTPKGKDLDLPTLALAEALAEEWSAQGEFLKPTEMYLTTLGCTTIDIVAPDRDGCISRMLPYLETDTLCFEDEEGDFAELQRKEWGPVRSWCEQHFDVTIALAKGLQLPAHPETTTTTLGRRLAEYDDWELATISAATSTAKSLIVALALAEKEGVKAEEAVRWAELEELFQIERWGLVEGDHDVSHASILNWFLACQRFIACRRTPS